VIYCFRLLLSNPTCAATTGEGVATTSNGLLTIRATASPLPIYVPRVIEDSAESLKQIFAGGASRQQIDEDAVAKLVPEVLSRLRSSQEAAATEEGGAEAGAYTRSLLSST